MARFYARRLASGVPDPLDYDRDGSAHAERNRLLKAMFAVIGLKVVLVIFNTWAAFEAGLPSLVRMVGVGLQFSLTVVFLLLLFRLTARR